MFKKFHIFAEEDDMIIFPAALNHEILPQKKSTKEPRITIATNVRISQENYEGVA